MAIKITCDICGEVIKNNGMLMDITHHSITDNYKTSSNEVVKDYDVCTDCYNRIKGFISESLKEGDE